jgi:DNA polymerase elongation subunit (family B)
MSYISSLRHGSDVLVWERGDSGVREVKRYPAPYFFYTEDDDGDELSILGKKLKRHDFATYDEFSQIRDRLRQGRHNLYESDIPPEIKILSQHYYGKPAPKLNITFLDIEVIYNDIIGPAKPENPYAPVTSISIHNMWQNRTVIYAVPPKSWDGNIDPTLHAVAEIKICRNEKELLLRFLEEIEDADILSGWNSKFFDIPYLCKRIETQLGPKYLRKMSFDLADTPRYRDMENYGKLALTVELSGRVHLDYWDLFLKYEEEKRQSYKLESVSEDVLPDMPKIKYEGSLNNLYEKDFNFFMRYNIRDTEILRGFEDKLGYVRLANEMCHISVGQFRDVTGTTRLSDYAVINYCHYEHHQKLRVFDYENKDTGEKIKGAWVLLPQSGLHSYCAAIDVTSLYPNVIIALNISPETLIGQFPEKMMAWEKIAKGTDDILLFEHNNEAGTIEEHTAKEWRHIIKINQWAVTGFGTIFDQKVKGIIPTILAGWFDKRKEHKKSKATEYNECKKLKESDPAKAKEHLDLSGYYDRLQYVYKIKMNSFYGAFLNAFFRYFDPRMGGSVTATGRIVLNHQAKKVTELLDGNYDVDFPLYETVKEAETEGASPDTALHGPRFKGEFESKCVIYGDTDSCYFETYAQNTPEAEEIAEAIAKLVNSSFKPFMQDAFLCNPGYDERVQTALELVSDRALFVVKKRYVLHLVNFEGNKVDKLKVRGLEMRKTTTPKPVQKFLENVVSMLLKDAPMEEIDQNIIDFRDRITNDVPFFELGLPIGIKNLENYTQEYKIHGEKAKMPGHVAASVFYNECLSKYDDKVTMPIVSGMKIKVFYLKEKQGKFKSIALPTDIDIIPEWFTMDYQPLIDRQMQSQKLVDDKLGLIFKAIGKEVPTRQTVMTMDLIGV